MSIRTTLTEQLKAFEDGIILDSQGESDDCYNFYDWFCGETSLKNKAFKLFPMVKTFVKKFEIDTDKVYVYFKNNCPMAGNLYDDFRICDIETGDVIYTVTPKSGHIGDGAEIWGKENDFNEPLYEGKTLSEIYTARMFKKLKAYQHAEVVEQTNEGADKVKLLIEDYNRRLITMTKMIASTSNDGSVQDIRRAERLKTKECEYRTVIADLERILN